MTNFEYNQKLREANAIHRDEILDKKADRVREKILTYLTIGALFIGSFSAVKAFADYNVVFFVCSICHSKNDSPSCCYGAHFTEVEYPVAGEPPAIWEN